MEERTTLSEWIAGDMKLVYRQGKETGEVGMILLPAALAGAEEEKDCRVEPLIRFRLSSMPWPGGYAHGRTMRGCSDGQLKYLGQDAERDGNKTSVVTRFSGPLGTLWRHTAAV